MNIPEWQAFVSPSKWFSSKVKFDPALVVFKEGFDCIPPLCVAAFRNAVVWFMENLVI